MGPDDRRGDRGVSIQVNYITSLGITTILVVGLVMSTGSFVDTQREQAASHELEAIGNRIATQISQADDLAARGGNVSVTITQPRRVVGESYSVRLEHGSACTSPVVGTDDCLVLRASQPGVTVKVPVVNTTNVDVASVGSGTFRVTATPSSTRTSVIGGGANRDVSMTAGVGSDVGVDAGNGSELNLANNQPVAKFTLDPGAPTVGWETNFTSHSSDPDGAITKYEWDPDGDGIAEGTGRSFNYSYTSPGRYNATLTVTDDNGVEDSESKTVIVGGLVYRGDAVARDYDGDDTPAGLTFNVTNAHGGPGSVEILEVYVDTEKDGIDKFGAASGTGEGGRPVYIDTNSGNHVVAGQPIDIYRDGVIIDLDEEGGNNPDIDPAETFQVALAQFRSGSEQNMTHEPVQVGLRYRIGDDYYVSKFNLSEPRNVPPTPNFDITCTDMECEFDASASSDSDGSITDYQWQFGDGDVGTGQIVDHEYSDNGSYTATLTVVDDNGTSASMSDQTPYLGDVSVDLNVNFQPADAEDPPGSDYVVDSGGAYDDRNGYRYGWMTDPDPSGSPTTVDETEHPEAHTDQWYDTLNRMEDSGDDRTWEVEVPDGRYRVYVAMGDPNPPEDCGWEGPFWDPEWVCSDDNPTNNVEIEGTTIDDPTPAESNHDNYTAVVEVTDGRLSISPAAGADDPKLQFVEIESVDTQSFAEDSGQSGLVVLEAEHFQEYRQGDDDGDGDDMEGHAWWRVDENPDASNGRALEVVPDDGDEAEATENGPRLDYEVDFDTRGEYDVWIRMRCPDSNADSVHAGLDGNRESDGEGLTDTCSGITGWTWVNRGGGDYVRLDVSSTGVHTVNVWANRDGTMIDRIVLTEGGDWSPPPDDSAGPDESDRN